MSEPTTELELLDWLKTNLRQAIEHCAVLAHHPFRGFIYDTFRKELLAIESACTRLAYHRLSDARWLTIGLMMGETHKKAGNWLRSARSKDSSKRVHPLFLKLSDNLKALHAKVVELETKKTGIIGPILPAPLPAPHRPPSVQVHKGYEFSDRRSKGGIVIPNGAIIH